MSEDRLIEIGIEIDSLVQAEDRGTLGIDDAERLAALREERSDLERELGDAVLGLRGYRGGPG